MLKTKYERMKKSEKQKLVQEYKKTKKGKEMMNRLLRLNVIGALLVLYAIYYFISNFLNLKWTDYFISIPILCIGCFFIIMSYRLRKKVLNNFAIKKK